MTGSDHDAAAAPRLDREYRERTRTTLLDALAWARERAYTGWDYGDGTSSRLLRAVPVDSEWLDLAVQETVKRAPVNVRPLFLVEQRRSFMGAALFAMANLNARALTGEERYAREARDLVEWLLSVQADEAAGFRGCHRHDLQGLERRVPAGTPGVVGTTVGGLALLHAAATVDASYAEVARTAARFVFEDLGYEEGDPEPGQARIDYKPGESDEHHTLNANALGARLLLELHAWFDVPAYREAATRILAYVAACQADLGGWHYRDPPDASHLSMDTHHNGFVIEAFQCYADVVGDGRFEDVLDRALAFYRERLFEPTGAPNYDETSAYPRDVHACAQGILVFTYAGDLAFARRIVEWTLRELSDGSGRFYYRKHRLYTKRFTLMRWCQAWTTYALSEHLLATEGVGEVSRASRRTPAGPPVPAE